MVRIALIRPGSTAFDEEGRIKGCLDIPLSEIGKQQAHRIAIDLMRPPDDGTAQPSFSSIYCGPCQSAQDTAEIIAESLGVKRQIVDCLQNVHHGLWQGKLIEELRRLQPKLYRQIQENSEAFAPPEGETIEVAQARIKKAVMRLVRKHRHGFIGLVVPDPLASLIRQLLMEGDLGDLWKAEQDVGSWEWITVKSTRMAFA